MQRDAKAAAERQSNMLCICLVLRCTTGTCTTETFTYDQRCHIIPNLLWIEGGGRSGDQATQRTPQRSSRANGSPSSWASSSAMLGLHAAPSSGRGASHQDITTMRERWLAQTSGAHHGGIGGRPRPGAERKRRAVLHSATSTDGEKERRSPA